jgi:hypothetical protein
VFANSSKCLAIFATARLVTAHLEESIVFRDLIFGYGKPRDEKNVVSHPQAKTMAHMTGKSQPKERLQDSGVFGDSKWWIFGATMQLRTPSRILEHHNEFFRGSFDALPRYASELWRGLWLP